MGRLDALFAPGRVAVVGATDGEGTVGRAITSNLLSTFDGDVVAVNPNRETVLGLDCYDSVTEVDDVDLAVIVVPPDAAVETVRRATGETPIVLVKSGRTDAGASAAAEIIGDRLGGVLFNRVPESETDELLDDVVPFLESRDVPVYGAVPRVAELAGVTVDELSQRLGSDVLTTDAPLAAHVERFTVGAMGGDSALTRFRRTRDAVVITGGDRPEVQTAALEASGIEALILTGGFRPPSAILGRAEEEGVPVLLVQSDTRTTIDRVEDVLRSGRTRSEDAVELMGELLADGVDVKSLLEIDV